MASNHTEHYQLNQWSLDDPVQMEDFNADNRKVEQALTALENNRLRLATGSYTGTGTYGEANPVTLTFPFKPKLFFSFQGDLSDLFVLVHSGNTQYVAPDRSSSDYTMYFSWTNNSISWYNKHNAFSQLNTKDKEYHYLAIGI
ncbi:MAG: hypothetical protein J6Q14_07760 [Oscillospiraceae bacterium]|nr:hypothetical protein [Oscillospiraceae bacterium]MBO5918645.1 hypothetical protein [Oscillospiraceae bacterium]